MRDYNKELALKTLDSYREAFARMFEVSEFIGLAGCGCPPLDIISGKARAECSVERFLPHATAVSVSFSNLRGVNGPEPINRTYRVWRDSFFVVRFYAEFQWATYQYQPASQEEDGTIIPAGECETPRTLHLESNDKRWGLGKWETAKKEILAMCDMTPEDIGVILRNRVCNADEAVGWWVDAMNKRQEVVLT